jgi:hypothetical protein
VNYGWQGYWQNYSPARTRIDIPKIKSFGFNCVRIFPGAFNGAFDWPQPTAAQLANFKDFFTVCRQHSIGLHLTLFDFNSRCYTDLNSSYKWADAIIGAVHQVAPQWSGLAAVEVKNEMFSDYSAAPSYWPTQLAFVNAMVAKLRTWLPAGRPVIGASVASGQNTYTRGLSKAATSHHGLQYYFNNTYGTNHQPSWYDYHLYGDASWIESQISAAIQCVGGHANLLRIGEFGLDFTGTVPTAAGLKAQAVYAQTARYYAHHYGLQAPGWWNYSDIAPNSYQFSKGQYDGLVDTSGKVKPAGQVYMNYPANTIPPLPS